MATPELGPDVELPPLVAGDVLAARYRIDALLGEGAASSVYAATQLVLQRPVAVKVLRARQLTARAHERFLREAQAVSRLAHPQVVQVHDFGIDDPTGRAFLVLERVQGPTLVQRLRERGPVDERTAARWMAQVARALAHAHARGIVHRDVKPANLMLTDPGDGSGELVKVLDFGLAKMTADDAAPALTAPGRPLGTIEFASPEQVLGLPTDARSDLYALGCVLFALLAARAPWGSGAAEAQARLHAAPPALPERLSDGRAPSASLVALHRRLLAREPDARPADAAAVAAALEAIAEGDEPRTMPDAPALADTVLRREGLGPSAAEATRGAPDEADATRTVPSIGPPLAELTRTVLRAGAVEDAAPRTITAPMVRSPMDDAIGSPRARVPWVLLGALVLAGGALAFALTRPSASEDGAAPVELARAVGEGGAHSPAPGAIAASPGATPAPSGASASPPTIVAIAPAARRLEVTSRPPGATVFVGDRAAGTTPLTLEVPALPLALTLRKPGYRDRTITASTTAPLDLALDRASLPPRAPRATASPSASPSGEPYRFW